MRAACRCAKLWAVRGARIGLILGVCMVSCLLAAGSASATSCQPKDAQTQVGNIRTHSGHKYAYGYQQLKTNGVACAKAVELADGASKAIAASWQTDSGSTVLGNRGPSLLAFSCIVQGNELSRPRANSVTCTDDSNHSVSFHQWYGKPPKPIGRVSLDSLSFDITEFSSSRSPNSSVHEFVIDLDHGLAAIRLKQAEAQGTTFTHGRITLFKPGTNRVAVIYRLGGVLITDWLQETPQDVFVTFTSNSESVSFATH